MSDERWYIVAAGGGGIISLSKYGWRGESTTRKASSFGTEELARKAAKRQAGYEKSFPAEFDVVQGSEAADKLGRERFEEAMRKRFLAEREEAARRKGP